MITSLLAIGLPSIEALLHLLVYCAIVGVICYAAYRLWLYMGWPINPVVRIIFMCIVTIVAIILICNLFGVAI